LAALEKEFADEGLAVVTICLGASSGEAREALKGTGADVLVLVDETTKTQLPYHASSTPTTYLIDNSGVIQMSQVGYGDGVENYLRAEIERLLED
jgi:hypothetical protein